MLKHIAIATLLSATLMSAAVLPAQARISDSDCSYARQVAGPATSMNHGSGGTNYSYSAQVVQQCLEQGK